MYRTLEWVPRPQTYAVDLSDSSSIKARLNSTGELIEEEIAALTPSTRFLAGMDNKTHFFTTPNPYEKKFGYHRAVRKGAHIVVSGTTAAKTDGDRVADPDEKDDSAIHFPNNAKKQAKLAMDRCAEAVKKLGGTRADILRVRIFVAVRFSPWYCSAPMGGEVSFSMDADALQNHEDCSDVGEAY